MPAPFTIEHEGRRIELIPDSSWKQDRVLLLVDGEHVAEAKADGANTVVAGDGVVVRAVLPWHGASIRRTELVREYWLPIVIGLALALREWRKRRRGGTEARRET